MRQQIDFISIQNPYRVGNWVMDLTGHVMQVQAVRGRFVSGLYSDDDGVFHEAVGDVDRAIGVVDLTPEILQKAGFQKNSFGDWFLVLHESKQLNDNTIRMMLTGEIPFIGYNTDAKTLKICTQRAPQIFVRCEFVHEIQNALMDAEVENVHFRLLD